MKTVFAALNAKYIHTNLAVRTVAACARRRGVDNLHIWEKTINHPHRQLLRELAAFDADLILFSCYIWNIGVICALARDLRVLCPGLLLGAAGPEVTFHSVDFLRENPAFDFVLPGEGEDATAALLLDLRQNKTPPKGVLPTPAPIDPDALPFPYPDLDQLTGRILYYESMRGCPFRCSYCLSAVDPGVRFRSLDLVFADLDIFLAARVPQVKLVDRTFNCNKKRAMAIWTYLRDHDNGVTGFHFELAGELLDDETVRLLATIQPGQFQFEIGVQSANPQTLKAISRPADLPRLFAVINRLQQPRNIHLHLDLIAGLPHEGYASFAHSFDAVYALGPHQFQPGFLKVLKGSPMERDAERFGLVYRQDAPYEILRNRWLTFTQLCRLHSIADLVEVYYNSGRFRFLLEEICREFPSPFAFYEALSNFYTLRGFDQSPPSKIGYYDILGDFLLSRNIAPTFRHQWLCRMDLALHEKIRKLPHWVTVDGSAPHRTRILAFLSDPQNVARCLPDLRDRDPKYIIKAAHVEVFPFHPVSGEPVETALAFDYSRRDITGRATITEIALPPTGDF